MTDVNIEESNQICLEPEPPKETDSSTSHSQTMEANGIQSSIQDKDSAQYPGHIDASQSQAPVIIIDHDYKVKDEIDLEYIVGGTAPASIWPSLRLKPGALQNSKKNHLNKSKEIH